MASSDVAAMAWREALPRWPAQSPVWSPERLRLFDAQLQRAEAALAEGRLESAADLWEEALERFHDVPEPRRQGVRERMGAALHRLAVDALREPEPDGDAALRFLLRSARWVPVPGTLLAIGMLYHRSGQLEEAEAWYGRAARAVPPAGGSASHGALGYAKTLLRLQRALQSGELEPALRGAITGLLPASPAPPGGDAAEADGGTGPLVTAAWQRLYAMALFCQGSAGEALAAFPRPGAGLPPRWALEGALLAALQGEWARYLAYYLRGHTPAHPLPGKLHRYVFLTALAAHGVPCLPVTGGEAWLLWLDTATALENTGLPAEPELAAWFAEPSRIPQWLRAVQGWRYRWELHRAREALAGGHWDQLHQRLQYLLSEEAREASGEAGTGFTEGLALWWACASAAGGKGREGTRGAGGEGQGARWLAQTAHWDEDDPVAGCLAVWAAEKFGEAHHVVERLNRLLNRHPGNPWALRRWRRWMLHLAQEAMEKGSYQQALLQYASLLMRIPDDVEGWRGCARVHALTGDAARAADCNGEADRLARADRPTRANRLPRARAHGTGGPSGGSGTGDPAERGLLAALLSREPVRAVPIEGCPFREEVLAGELRASFLEPDLYLGCLVARWADSFSSSRKEG